LSAAASSSLCLYSSSARFFALLPMTLVANYPVMPGMISFVASSCCPASSTRVGSSSSSYVSVFFVCCSLRALNSASFLCFLFYSFSATCSSSFGSFLITSARDVACCACATFAFSAALAADSAFFYSFSSLSYSLCCCSYLSWSSTCSFLIRSSSCLSASIIACLAAFSSRIYCYFCSSKTFSS